MYIHRITKLSYNRD